MMEMIVVGWDGMDRQKGTRSRNNGHATRVVGEETAAGNRNAKTTTRKKCAQSENSQTVWVS